MAEDAQHRAGRRVGDRVVGLHPRLEGLGRVKEDAQQEGERPQRVERMETFCLGRRRGGVDAAGEQRSVSHDLILRIAGPPAKRKSTCGSNRGARQQELGVVLRRLSRGDDLARFGGHADLGLGLQASGCQTPGIRRHFMIGVYSRYPSSSVARGRASFRILATATATNGRMKRAVKSRLKPKGSGHSRPRARHRYCYFSVTRPDSR